MLAWSYETVVKTYTNTTGLIYFQSRQTSVSVPRIDNCGEESN